MYAYVAYINNVAYALFKIPFGDFTLSSEWFARDIVKERDEMPRYDKKTIAGHHG